MLSCVGCHTAWYEVDSCMNEPSGLSIWVPVKVAAACSADMSQSLTLRSMDELRTFTLFMWFHSQDWTSASWPLSTATGAACYPSFHNLSVLSPQAVNIWAGLCSLKHTSNCESGVGIWWINLMDAGCYTFSAGAAISRKWIEPPPIMPKCYEFTTTTLDLVY